MSRKSTSILRDTYKEYTKYVLADLKDLANFLIQNFDWDKDNMVSVFKQKLKEGIENNGVILRGNTYAFPIWKLKIGFTLLDDCIRKYK